MHKFGNLHCIKLHHLEMQLSQPLPPPPPLSRISWAFDPTPLQFPIPSMGGYEYLLKPHIRHESACRRDHPHKFPAFDICLSQRNLWFHKISLSPTEGMEIPGKEGGIVLKQCMMLNWNFQRVGGWGVIGQIPSEGGYGYFMEPHNYPPC